MTLPQNILAIDYGKIQSNKYVNIYMYFVFIVYPVIFMFFFAIFAITFTSQNIQYAKIISGIDCY